MLVRVGNHTIDLKLVHRIQWKEDFSIAGLGLMQIYFFKDFGIDSIVITSEDLSTNKEGLESVYEQLVEVWEELLAIKVKEIKPK